MDEDERKLIINARNPQGELGSKLLDRMNQSHEQMAQWALTHLEINKDQIILDIGCGGGRNVLRFSKQALKVYGLDYSKTSVLKSSKLNEKGIASGKVEIIEGSVSDLPFEDESVDIATGFETIYFWPDFINDLKEVRRVLKKDGLVFFCNELVKGDEFDTRHKEIIELLDMKLFNEETYKIAFNQVGFTDYKFYRKDNWLCAIARKI